jgi:hypothetical protein
MGPKGQLCQKRRCRNLAYGEFPQFSQHSPFIPEMS